VFVFWDSGRWVKAAGPKYGIRPRTRSGGTATVLGRVPWITGRDRVARR